jgi:CMP-N,N'-diacetyllegionaminic acid synthase
LKVLAIIPAREGSKGVKDKNVQPLNNKPLIYWTIKEAQRSAVDRVIVSTDSERYRSILEQYGTELFPFIRPEKYAKDKTPSSDVVLHALDYFKKQDEVYDIVLLLEPTSPLRTAEQINEALEKLRNHPRARAIVSVVEQPSYNPILAFEIGRDTLLVPYGTTEYPGHPQRQALRPAYFMSGDIYASYVDTYREKKTFDHDLTIAYIVPAWQAQEIDYPHDLVIMEALMLWRDNRR